MFALVTLAVAACGAAFGLLLWALVLPRFQAAARAREIAAYGFAGHLPGPANRPAPRRAGRGPIVGIATRLGNLIAARIGPARERRIRTELLAAGIYGLTPRALLGFGMLSAALLGVLALLYEVGSPVLKVGLVALAVRIGWGLPTFVVRRRGRMRLATIDRQLPDLIDLLVVTVEAGLGFSGSVQVAATRMNGPLGDELRLTLQEQRMGRTLRDALEQMLQRTETPAMRSFVRAVTQGEALGVSIGSILRGLALEMRRRRRQLAEEQAQKAPVKMLFPLVFLIFPAIGIVVLAPAAFGIFDTLGSV